MAELPFNLLPAVIFGILVFWISGLNPDTFGEFMGILMLEVCTALSLGLAISAAASTVEVAISIGIPFVLIPLLFGGFYINLNSLDAGADLVPYISFIKWAFQAFCINEFKGAEFTCSGGATQQCLSTGEQVLKSLAFDGSSVSDAVLGLGMMFVGLMCLACWILYRNSPVFIGLGHVGTRFAKLGCDNSSEDDDSEEKVGITTNGTIAIQSQSITEEIMRDAEPVIGSNNSGNIISVDAVAHLDSITPP